MLDRGIRLANKYRAARTGIGEIEFLAGFGMHSNPELLHYYRLGM